MNKLEEELLIMNYFRKVYPDFPKGKLVKSESPDFILKCSPKYSIGIELTRLNESEKSIKEKIIFSLEESTLKRV